jgi:hypothetical protein
MSSPPSFLASAAAAYANQEKKKQLRRRNGKGNNGESGGNGVKAAPGAGGRGKGGDSPLDNLSSDVSDVDDGFSFASMVKAAPLPRDVRSIVTEASVKADALKRRGSMEVKRLQAKMKAPKFVRFIDRLAFCVGIGLLMLTEFLLLVHPGWLDEVYLILMWSLIALRYHLYHRDLKHFYLLDMCYYAQVLLSYFLVVHPHPRLFQWTYSIASGPLFFAVVLWSNMFVPHSVDKLTSLIVHTYPPMVVYAIRWNPARELEYSYCPGGVRDCEVGWRDSFFIPLVLYAFWQMIYLVKTEVLDRNKLEEEPELETSLRYLTVKRPHPVYKALKARGVTLDGVYLIVVVQAVYTIATLLPIGYIFSSYFFNSAYLIAVFGVAVYNGASHYFEVFSRTYLERLEHKEDRQAKGTVRTSWNSIVRFLSFFVLFGATFVFLVEALLLYVDTQDAAAAAAAVAAAAAP